MWCCGIGPRVLGGGFKYFLFPPLPGEDSHFDWYVSKGLKPPTRVYLKLWFIFLRCLVSFDFFDRDIGWNCPSRAVKLCLSLMRYEKKNCLAIAVCVSGGCSALHTWNDNMLWKSTCLIDLDFFANWSPFLLTMDWMTGIPKKHGADPILSSHQRRCVPKQKLNFIAVVLPNSGSKCLSRANP